MGLILHCVPPCLVYSSHTGSFSILSSKCPPWAPTFHSLFSSPRMFSPQQSTTWFLHFLQNAAQMSPLHKSFPWPSYLKDQSFSSFLLPLTCHIYTYVYMVNIYIFTFCLPPFLMVDWIIIFNSLLPLRPSTMWLQSLILFCSIGCSLWML